MGSASTVQVLVDRLLQVTPVSTVASDEWRAAVVLRGEFDIANAPELAAELDQHIDAGRRVIRVDGSAVDFMDCAAMGALIAASARCSAEHGTLILTGLSRRLRRLLSLAGLDQLLLIDSADRGGRA